MRISDWSSDVCSSDLKTGGGTAGHNGLRSTDAHIGNDFRRVRIGIGHPGHRDRVTPYVLGNYAKAELDPLADMLGAIAAEAPWLAAGDGARFMNEVARRSEEHTSELQSLMRISYAVFCLKKKNIRRC